MQRVSSFTVLQIHCRASTWPPTVRVLHINLLVYFNSSGELGCLDITTYSGVALDRVHYEVGQENWDFQACTGIPSLVPSVDSLEMYLPISSSGGGLFPPFEYSIEAVEKYCQKRWKAAGRPQWLNRLYPTYAKSDGSPTEASERIFFSK